MLLILKTLGQALILGIFSFLSLFGFNFDYAISDNNVSFKVGDEQRDLFEDILKINQNNLEDFGEQKKQYFSPNKFFTFLGSQKNVLLELVDKSPVKVTFLHEIDIWKTFEQELPIESVVLIPEVEIELDNVTDEDFEPSSKPSPEPLSIIIPPTTPTQPRQPLPTQKPVPAAPSASESQIPKPDLQGKIGSYAEVAVNIVCKQPQGNMISATTGSGVMVSPSGVILTNAHVAQYVLLEDGGHNTDCIVYRNNIADHGYHVDVIYFPTGWMEENANSMKEANPRGTGEFDFALLYITKSTKKSERDLNFPYAKISLDNNKYKKGNSVNITGYPGGVSKLFDMDRSDILKTDKSKIKEVYSFNRQDNIDLFSTLQTHVAQRGASGGGIFSTNDLIGITVTISEGDGGSSINSITTQYINSAMQDHYGKGLLKVLSEDPNTHLDYFKSNSLKKLYNFINN